MPSVTSREWRLRARPVGEPETLGFRAFQRGGARTGRRGRVQVRNAWMTVDPYMRGRMNEARNYGGPLRDRQGDDRRGVVGTVLQSRDDRFKPGDLCDQPSLGWREAFTATPEAAGLINLPATRKPPQAFLGVLGMPGAHGAVRAPNGIGAPKPGETVFVSGAAGAVGSLVGQLAKLKGCRAIGSAGGKEKCDWLKAAGVRRGHRLSRRPRTPSS